MRSHDFVYNMHVIELKMTPPIRPLGSFDLVFGPQ